MDGVAAKVTIEIFVSLEECDVDSLACEKESENGAGRARSYDATGCLSTIHRITQIKPKT